MEKLITECILSEEEQTFHFRFYGEVEWEERPGQEPAIDFPAISIVQVENEREIPFVIRATTWHGSKLTGMDAITDVLSRYARKDTSIKILFMEDTIKTYLDALCQDIIETEIGIVPKRIVYGSFLDIYHLELVTDQYIYYSYDSIIVMLSAEDRGVIADNYFAEVGYFNSEEAIAHGTEKQLYKYDYTGGSRI